MVSLLVLLAYLQVENKPASGLTFKTPNTQGTKRAIDSLKVSLRFLEMEFQMIFQAFDKAGDQYRLACHEYAHKIMTLSMKVSFSHAATQQFTLVSK